MGQKVNPHGYRVGVIKDWDSRWMAKKGQFADFIVEDDKIRKFIKKKHYEAGISKIEIERAANKISVTIYTAKPGMVIGQKGAGMEALRADLYKLTGKAVVLNVVEVRRPDMDAQLVAENVAQQLERRISFRRAMKQCIGRAMRSGLKGIKICVGGRLGGADIARSEQYHEGSIPLQTLRLRKNLLIGCINRAGKILIPSGQDTIEPGDTVVVVTSVTGLNELDDILDKRRG